MKKIYTLLFLISSSLFFVHAQLPPVITQANYPIVGDSYTGIFDFSASWAPGPDGINQTWDFTELAGGTNAFNYVTPSSTPYGATFTSSNIALSPLPLNYFYFLSSSEKFENTGTVTFFSSSTVRPYTNPQTLITFPFTYLNSFKDTAQTSNYLVGGGNYQRRILYSETTADAYGTVQLPAGTYNNVLRLLTTSKTIDSTFSSSDIFVKEDISIDTNYYWISSDFKPHVLTLSKSVQDPDGAADETIFAQYFSNPGPPTGTINPFNANISVYPNPVASDLIVEIEKNILSSNPGISFCLLNSTGYEVVSCKKIISDKINIPLGKLIPGIYFYRIIAEEKILSSGKITVE